MSSKNKFSSALRHLNSNLDEKVRKLEEQPTNNTGTLYTLVPPNPDASPNVFTPEYQTKTTAPLDLSVGSDPTSSAEAEDTSGLFDAEGLPMTATPPGDTSYILGPMSTMYYAWASRTQIGYIRESDRRMVNLGYITGNFGGWDGNEAAFNSYGQLTLEQAQWYRTIGKKDGADNSTENYRAFYPGPPSSVADAYGRYLCTITGEPKETTTDHPQSNSGSAQGPGDATDNYGAQKKKEEDEEEDKKKDDKDKDKDEDKSEWDELMKQARKIDADSKVTVDMLNASMGTEIADAGLLTLPAGIALWKVASLVLASAYMSLPEFRQAVSDWVGYYQSKSWEDEFLDGPGGEAARERSRADDAAAAKAARERAQAADEALDDAIASGDQGAIDQAQNEVDNAAKNQERVQNQINANRKGRGRRNRPGERNRPGQKGTTGQVHGEVGMYNSYEPSGKILSESKKIRIMKTLKEPVVLPEGKKKSYKVRPGRRGKTDFKGMDKLIGDTKIEKTFKEPQDIWNKDWHGYNQRKSQDKKNIVLELVGQSTDAYNYMLTDSKKMNAKQMEEFWGLHPEMYSQFNNGKKYKTIRKEELKGDRLVFLVDEKGVKTSILQSKLNDQLAQKHDQELLDEYNKLNPPKEEPVKKKPLLKKVADRLSPDVAPVYPKNPPPKMVNGMHPKYGKNYKYDKLDSVSAVMMSRAPTGDPEIDANVRKAAKKPK
tara:strand:+ start:529 stop:2673 length:2145 start_codon:yes stop_codon:yes gene_type:complete